MTLHERPTPETDAAAGGWNHLGQWEKSQSGWSVKTTFARNLEQRLAAAREALQAIVDDDQFCGDNYGDRRSAWIVTAKEALTETAPKP